MPATIADLFFKALLDTKSLQADAKKAGDAAGQTMGQSLGGRLSGTLKSTVGGAAIGATLGGAFTAATSSAVEFEDQLRTINTVANLSDEELKGVGDSIIQLSRDSGKSTADLTSGFYDLVSAGVDANDAIGVLRDSAKFATGALGSTAQSVDLVTSVMNAYGLQASDSARITDVFAKAVQDGKVTAAQLGDSIATVAPIAASAGISIEEVSSGFAQLTAKGVPAAEAATQMRSAIVALLTPNAQLNAIQEKTGINFAELAKQKGLAVALEELRKATGGSADAFGQALGRVEAYNFALSATGDNAGAFAQQIDETMTTSGLAQAQYEEKSKSALEQGKRLLANIHAFAIEVGGPFVSSLGPAIFALNQLGGSGKLVGAIIGGLAGNLASAAGGLAKVGTTIGTKLAAAIGVEIAASTAISEGVGQGVAKAGTSSAVVGQATGLGKFLGGKIGAGLSLGIIGIGAAAIYEAQKAQYNAVEQKVADDFDRFVSGQTLEQLTKMRTELASAMASPIGQIQTGISSLFGSQGLQTQLNSLDAAIQSKKDTLTQAATGIPREVATGLAAGGPAIAAGADAMMQPLPGEVDAAGDAAKAEAGDIPAQIADGIRSQRSDIFGGFKDLKKDLKHALSPAKEVAKIEGILASKALAKALRSNDKQVAAEAQALKERAEARLAELKGTAKTAGEKGGQAMATGIASKEGVVKGAAKDVAQAAKDPLQNLDGPFRQYGYKVGVAFANGLRASIPVVIAAAKAVAAAPDPYLHGKSPPPAGPLHEIDTWGENIGSAWGAGLTDSIGGTMTGLKAALATLRGQLAQGGQLPAYAQAGPSPWPVGVPGLPSMAGVGNMPMATAGSGKGDTYNINVPVSGLVRARDPFEIAGQLRRLADQGLLAPRERKLR